MPLYPPSGHIRTYGVDFFIYSYSLAAADFPYGDPTDHTIYVVAATNEWRPDPYNRPYSLIPFPSDGMLNYFDYKLADYTATDDEIWGDCMTEIFAADAQGSGGPTIL